MPAESIVVKENYKPDKALAEGNPKGCLSCHGQKKDNDWLYTGN